jgi:hypothetical protein
MHTALKIATIAAALSLAPLAWGPGAEAGKVEGVGIGTGFGAVIAGPVGAIVGGVVGYKVGGPDILPRKRTCWRGADDRRYCRRR